MMRTRNFLIALAGIGLMSGCKQQQPTAPEIDITASESAPKTVTLPIAEAPLDRQAILLAASQAASNYALGQDDVEPQKQLDGKRFAIRLRFGCEGPVAKASGARSWTFDEGRRAISFKVMLDIEAANLPVAVPPASPVEAIEGFWIERPWMLKAGCPSAASSSVAARAESSSAETHPLAKSAAPVSSNEQPAAALPHGQVGVAQFFLDTEARTHRRANRAYEATKFLPEGAVPSPNGYDVVIVGRLWRLTDGRVIACSSNGAAAAPSCFVSVQIDTVSIEAAGGGETFATWTGA